MTLIKPLNLIGCDLQYIHDFVLRELLSKRTKAKNTCGDRCQLIDSDIQIMNNSQKYKVYESRHYDFCIPVTYPNAYT